MYYFIRITVVLCFNFLFAFSYGQDQRPADFQVIDSLIKKGELKSAEEKTNQIIYTETTDSLIAKGQIYLGKIKLLQGKLDTALSSFMDAKEHLKVLSAKDKVELFSGIGVVYSKAKKYKSAEENFKTALSGYKQSDFWRLKTLVNLGGVYMERDNFESLRVYKEALELAREINRPKIEAVILTNLSNFYIKELNWGLAVDMADKSLKIRDSLQMPLSVITYNNIGYALVQSDRVREGIDYYDKALPYADAQELQQLLYNLRSAYIALEDYEKSIAYYNRYDSVKDRIAERKYEEKIATIRAAYKTAEKERKIAVLEAENKIHQKEITWLILGSILLFLLISVVIYFRIKHIRVKQALQQSKLRSKFLRLQLNPHFLFNALQQIQYYIYRNERDTSMQYLDNFSKLIRLILEHSDDEYIRLVDELAILSNYLELQKTPAHAEFLYQINCDVQDPEAIKIPVMLLQPFVENAVVHGAKQNPKEGRIELLFKNSGDEKRLYIEIVDNGRGIHAVKQQNHKKLHRSMGQEILKNRVEEFNKMNKTKIRLKIQKAFEDEAFPGTKVILSVPYLEF